MYGSLVAAPDSIRTPANSRVASLLPSALLDLFQPRTSPPGVATVLRSILWPLAILLVIHRSYVLATNGYITDDYGPVYRAVVNLKMGWAIYNEHLNYVDPHYLYPPGGTLIMAPFGYLPVDASRYWFITINAVAIVIAAYLIVRLFNYTFTSVAFPALLVAMFCTESVINTLVFGNINGCVLLLEVLFFRWLLDGKTSHQWWAGVAIGLTLVLKPVIGPLLLLPLLIPPLPGKALNASLFFMAFPIVAYFLLHGGGLSGFAVSWLADILSGFTGSISGAGKGLIATGHAGGAADPHGGPRHVRGRRLVLV